MIKKVVRKQNNAKDCFVCGFDNPSGLNAEFYELEDNSLAARVNIPARHQSYPQRVHGGVSAAILDEAIGRAITAIEPQSWGVTAEINVRYKKPLPYETPLTVTASITENNHRMFCGEGRILLPDNSVAVVAKARYVKLKYEAISETALDDSNWCELKKEDDPEFFDVPE